MHLSRLLVLFPGPMSRLLALVVLLVAAPALGQPVLLQQLSSPTPTPESRFGSAVALGGDAVVVGQPGEAGAVGRVFAFVRAPGSGTWEFEAELFPDSLEDAGEFKPAFGAAVAFDGPYALVGAPYESSGVVNSGVAYLFRRDEQTGAWTDVARLKSPVPVLRDQFGAAVAISGATVAIGAHGNDEAGENAGAVYVFERTGGAEPWHQMQRLIAMAPQTNAQFGASVRVDGDRAVVGAPLDGTQVAGGAAYTFERADGVWAPTHHLVAGEPEEGALFGIAAAQWDTRGLPAGVYFVRLVSADRTATRRALVVR